ncbi:hypothetical protein CH63R_01113 [Colletotrichum higginsianum IMI 349063]|uniref:Uncharacterized protein n=2 Tax=Colletotrichum higginsianum TaxID=80884 RepID=A0A1B7YV87_COLHI|nr:hypothetical protein CH63R_01113 [Colletotrichum higginsianum IMI 349063]OBR15933.1 hypothetical protein CH63R_01113 [Colletotrichum higginsianum IMI 349063]TID03771.1 hypothetical protein CH35J_002325 [Colletotrichum higginsianum]
MRDTNPLELLGIEICLLARLTLASLPSPRPSVPDPHWLPGPVAAHVLDLTCVTKAVPNSPAPATAPVMPHPNPLGLSHSNNLLVCGIVSYYGLLPVVEEPYQDRPKKKLEIQKREEKSGSHPWALGGPALRPINSRHTNLFLQTPEQGSLHGKGKEEKNRRPA